MGKFKAFGKKKNAQSETMAPVQEARKEPEVDKPTVSFRPSSAAMPNFARVPKCLRPMHSSCECWITYDPKLSTRRPRGRLPMCHSPRTRLC